MSRHLTSPPTPSLCHYGTSTCFVYLKHFAWAVELDASLCTKFWTSDGPLRFVYVCNGVGTIDPSNVLEFYMILGFFVVVGCNSRRLPWGYMKNAIVSSNVQN